MNMNSEAIMLQDVEDLYAEEEEKKEDCTGTLGLSTLLKCTSAIRQLAYDTLPGALDEYLQMGQTTSRLSLEYFCRDDYKRLRYKRMYEAAKKDVELAFGVLEKKWAILANPIHGSKRCAKASQRREA
ncbi:hypothetical protein Tco_1079980 [Tanacetum coccineum]|uniref:Uncharacterized protein n=1 Tax=Tanacetum coccineum TaxID=301880 RepID=A0ABQ5HTC9_9ASTR